jgi:hypothetical protein
VSLNSGKIQGETAAVFHELLKILL